MQAKFKEESLCIYGYLQRNNALLYLGYSVEQARVIIVLIQIMTGVSVTNCSSKVLIVNQKIVNLQCIFTFE